MASSIALRQTPSTTEDEGIFLVTLDEDGRCTDFREWWNSRTSPRGL
jgi:hypothetical protein